MLYRGLLLALMLALFGCKTEDEPAEIRLVRTLVVDFEQTSEDRQVIGEVKPRYESELSFRVDGKVLSRLVDVGDWVKQGDTLATLDTQDYLNNLNSAEADVSAARAVLAEEQGEESRQAKLLKDGWTPKAKYDAALRDLRTAEAELAAREADLALARDRLQYTELKAEFDGVITTVGAEAGQNVSAGQMVVKLARQDDKDGVFHVAETAFAQTALADAGHHQLEVVVWSLSDPELLVEGVIREISPVADSSTRTYTVKVTLKDPPRQVRFGMSIGGRLKDQGGNLAVALPLSALFEKAGAPAVWVVDQASGSVSLRPVTVGRYETDRVLIADGLAKGDIVVTAGVNRLREGQEVRLAEAALAGSNGQ